MMNRKNKHIIISGGGTGGHVFPAIAIAQALQRSMPDSEILFVGANGRMEMEKVPAAGFNIIGLPISGLQRKFSLAIIRFVYNLFRSLSKAKKILKTFKPDICVGVGGYASYAVLRIAAKKGIPTIIQEQNSYAGIANKRLARSVSKICVAYDNMEKFFPAEKVIITGNPVRSDLIVNNTTRQDALDYFKLNSNKPVLLTLGGSLGARTINNSIKMNLDLIKNRNVQLIWQTGRYYFNDIQKDLNGRITADINITAFISRMDMAYSVADVIISRAGALSISELSMVGKPVILVPSPNVAEDHQTKNARALSDKNAALLIPDIQAEKELVSEALALIEDKERCRMLSQNIAKMAISDSADRIAGEILDLIKE
jgi:UDP-N-acetylglucosamine--N-acetylmuramyl-(pentapeptide) pyrophosphoryl-undecaprenol N-acetylglucosamine transferase